MTRDRDDNGGCTDAPGSHVAAAERASKSKRKPVTAVTASPSGVRAVSLSSVREPTADTRTLLEARSDVRRTGDMVTPGPWSDGSSDTMTWLATLLHEEGTDLMKVTEEELKRGTPLFVQADSDVLEVQRRMARHHIRMLPVLSDGALIGVVDLVDLARREDLDSGDDLLP